MRHNVAASQTQLVRIIHTRHTLQEPAVAARKALDMYAWLILARSNALPGEEKAASDVTEESMTLYALGLVHGIYPLVTYLIAAKEWTRTAGLQEEQQRRALRVTLLACVGDRSSALAPTVPRQHNNCDSTVLIHGPARFVQGKQAHDTTTEQRDNNTDERGQNTGSYTQTDIDRVSST